MQKNTKFSTANNFYYMYGKHPTLAALNNPDRIIKKAFCTKDNFDNHKELISKHKYEIVQNNFITGILGNDPKLPHQGIAILVKSIFTRSSNISEETRLSKRIVILDQISDPQNIGSIIRNAAAFSIDTIIIPHDNSPTETAIIAKAASGTLETIRIITVINIKTVMEHLKKQGFWIIGLDSSAKDPLKPELFLHNKSPLPKIALVLGAEGSGLRRLTKETCDYIVKIPISDKVESLNVSNAAAIAFYLSFTAANV